MKQGPRILIIDDDAAIRRLLRRWLAGAGYRVQDIASDRGAHRFVAERQFDLLILDIDPPTSRGPEAIRILRALFPIPILALSVRGDEDTIADALDSGADDYIRKPFSVKELLARVKNALRRRARESGKPAQIRTGDLEIDLLLRRVRLRGLEVHLPAKLYEVLRILAEGAGNIISHKEILTAVWGPRCVDRIDYLRHVIQQLRCRLETDPAHPKYVLTKPQFGYYLDMQRRAEDPALS